MGIAFVLATSRICYRVIKQNLWQDTKSALFYIIYWIIYIFVWKGSTSCEIEFYFILFFVFKTEKEFNNICSFSHVSLFCSNSLRYHLTRQTRYSRIVDSRVGLSRGCDSFRKILHWILDAFPTVVNAKESGFLAIATRDSPHFGLTVLTRGILSRYFANDRRYCMLALYIVSIARSLEQDMRHTFQMLRSIRRAGSHNIAQIVFQGPHVV